MKFLGKQIIFESSWKIIEVEQKFFSSTTPTKRYDDVQSKQKNKAVVLTKKRFRLEEKKTEKFVYAGLRLFTDELHDFEQKLQILSI